MTPDHEAEFRQTTQVIRGKLATHAERLGDGARPSFSRPQYGRPHARPEIAVLPVMPECLVPRWGRPCRVREVSLLAAHALGSDDARVGENLEVVLSRPEGEMEGTNDGPKVISWEEIQVLYDPAPCRVVQGPEIRVSVQVDDVPASECEERTSRRTETTCGSLCSKDGVNERRSFYLKRPQRCPSDLDASASFSTLETEIVTHDSP